MFSFNPQVYSSEIVLEKHVSVKAAAEFSAYNIQYLRRLLRAGQLEGLKIGQVWLVKLASLHRVGPQSLRVPGRWLARLFLGRAHCLGWRLRL